MCMNCFPHRHHESTACSLPLESPEHDGPVAGWLNRPLSRGVLLKATGGALAFTLAGGMLHREILLGDVKLPYNLVLIVLDGARPEYFNVPGIPHVRALMQKGTQYTNAFAGILESETPAAHVSLSTGSEPRKTGIPSFWWANDQDNVEISLFSPAKIRAGDMEKIIKQSGVPTLAGRIHAKAPSARVVALSGSKYYAADALGGPAGDVTMYFGGTANGMFVPTAIPGHTPPPGILSASGLTTKNKSIPLGVENHLAMKLAVNTFNRLRQQVTLINLPEFDWPLGHVNGGILAPNLATKLMQSFDSDMAMLQEAYAKAGVLKKTIFVLMADHGMMPLTHRIPAPDLQGAVEKAGTSIVTDAYSSAGYLWLKDDSRIPQAARNIAAMQSPYIQAVYMRTKTKTGVTYVRATGPGSLHTPGTEVANQYLLQTFAGVNSPDLAVLFTEGVGSEPGGQAGWKADHGGTSWQAQHLPLILSGPGIRSGYTSAFPARLIDIAPTLLQLMGASHKGMQGIPLADALTSRPSWAVQWQQAANKRLMPVVQALKQQSRLEVAARL